MLKNKNIPFLVNKKDKKIISVWYYKDGIRLIDKIIQDELDIEIPLEKEVLKAIKILMRDLESKRQYKIYLPDIVLIDEKGREYISYNDKDFKNALRLYENGEITYGGIIYVIEIKAEYYVGLTERNLKDRYTQHILTTLNAFIKTNGDINKPSFGKLQNAIIKILKKKYDIKEIYSKIKYYHYTKQYGKRNNLVREILEYIRPFVKSKIIELHYGIKKISIREKYYTKQFPIKLLYGKSSKGQNVIDLKKNGLNMVYGGGGTVYFSVPIYDIAIMIALGLSAPKISKILRDYYGLERSNTRIIQHKIADLLGGAYKAQEDFLRPILERALKNDNITRHALFMKFKEAELMTAWFHQWKIGIEILNNDIIDICKKFEIDPKSDWKIIKSFLDKRIRYYAGIPEFKWLDWIFKFIPKNKRMASKDKITIEELSGIKERQLNLIIKQICKRHKVRNYFELKWKLHREKVLQLLEKGHVKINKKKIQLNQNNFHTIIYFRVFKMTRRAKDYFLKRLFERMSLVEIWNMYSK